MRDETAIRRSLNPAQEIEIEAGVAETAKTHAWFGQRLSKNIQGAEGIGLFDHFAGLAFGVARGAIALVFFVVLLHLALDESRIPGFIQNAACYPLLSSVADYVNENATKVGQDVHSTLPSKAETGQ